MSAGTITTFLLHGELRYQAFCSTCGSDLKTWETHDGAERALDKHQHVCEGIERQKARSQATLPEQQRCKMCGDVHRIPVRRDTGAKLCAVCWRQVSGTTEAPATIRHGRCAGCGRNLTAKDVHGLCPRCEAGGITAPKLEFREDS